MFEIRRGLILATGSSFVTFSVLLMQVNNGGLGKLDEVLKNKTINLTNATQSTTF